MGGRQCRAEISQGERREGPRADLQRRQCLRDGQKALRRTQRWKGEVQGAGRLTDAKGVRCVPQVSVKCYRVLNRTGKNR